MRELRYGDSLTIDEVGACHEEAPVLAGLAEPPDHASSFVGSCSGEEGKVNGRDLALEGGIDVGGGGGISRGVELEMEGGEGAGIGELFDGIWESCGHERGMAMG